MNKGGDVVSSADLQSPFSGLQSSVSTRRSPISGLHPLRLLALGRLEKAKGFDVILYALAGIWESGRGAHPSTPSCNWVLEIAGVGPDERRLKNLVSQLGIEERVRFIGRVPDDRLAEVFARADLFLSPDLTQPAFGLVALEAMIQGTPVLASRSGALPEVIGRDGGWLATPGDAQAWREALAILLSRPEQLEAQGRAAQHAARRFSLDRMVDGVEEAYRKALGGSRSSG